MTVHAQNDDRRLVPSACSRHRLYRISVSRGVDEHVLRAPRDHRLRKIFEVFNGVADHVTRSPRAADVVEKIVVVVEAGRVEEHDR